MQDIFNFGTNGAAGTNGTSGIVFCMGSTAGYTPTTLSFDLLHRGSSPLWHVVTFNNSLYPGTWTPVAGDGATFSAPSYNAFFSKSIDLTPTLTAWPHLANKAGVGPLCFGVFAMWTPGTSTYSATLTTNTYSASSGESRRRPCALSNQCEGSVKC